MKINLKEIEHQNILLCIFSLSVIGLRLGNTSELLI
jgi:hypothetical protein